MLNCIQEKGHVNAWRVPVQWLPSVNMTTPSDDKLVPSRPLSQPFGFTRIFPANSFIRVIIHAQYFVLVQDASQLKLQYL